METCYFRILPTGSGFMVWYQMFEYAIGHWLQKSTEHVMGCVLCSPGCFSLFRGQALMDTNVMRKYNKDSEKPLDFVQASDLSSALVKIGFYFYVLVVRPRGRPLAMHVATSTRLADRVLSGIGCLHRLLHSELKIKDFFPSKKGAIIFQPVLRDSASFSTRDADGCPQP